LRYQSLTTQLRRRLGVVRLLAGCGVAMVQACTDVKCPGKFFSRRAV
jgi:hypothetical protein